MSVKTNVRETANAVIMKVSGRIALGASGPSLQDGIRELLDGGHKNIILDLGGVTFLDSSGLGQLVGGYATAVSQGSEIKLLNLNRKVYDLMQVTKLYTVFAIYTDEAAALKSFGVAPVSG
jgi:anti-sigma B factor antagonist